MFSRYVRNLNWSESFSRNELKRFVWQAYRDVEDEGER